MAKQTAAPQHQPLTESQRTRLQRASGRYTRALETAQREYERKSAPARAALDRAVFEAQKEHDAEVADILAEAYGEPGSSS